MKTPVWVFDNTFLYNNDKQDALFNFISQFQRTVTTRVHSAMNALDILEQNGLNPDRHYVVPYGSANIVELFLRDLPAAHGLWYNEEFSFQNQINHCGHLIGHWDLFNGDAKKTALARKGFWTSNHVFVRPDYGLKSFPGGVYYVDELKDLVDKYQLNEHDPVWVTEPKDMSDIFEYRIFIVGGKVVAKTWKADNKADDRFMHDLCRLWQPHETCVVDVAVKVVHGTCLRTYIMEYNCLNCAGTYDADINQLGRALVDYVEQQSAKA